MRERARERERARDRETERETERARARERACVCPREIERERERERGRERERERGSTRPVALGMLREPAERETSLLTTYWSESTFIIVMIRWTGLAPWQLEFPFPCSLRV